MTKPPKQSAASMKETCARACELTAETIIDPGDTQVKVYGIARFFLGKTISVPNPDRARRDQLYSMAKIIRGLQ